MEEWGELPRLNPFWNFVYSGRACEPTGCCLVPPTIKPDAPPFGIITVILIVALSFASNNTAGFFLFFFFPRNLSLLHRFKPSLDTLRFFGRSLHVYLCRQGTRRNV